MIRFRPCLLGLSLAFSAGCLASTAQGATLQATEPSGANVELITAATFSPDASAADTGGVSGQVDRSVVVTSITTASGTYTGLVGPTSAVASGERYWPLSESDPGSDAATLLGLVADSGILNPSSNNVTVQFGQSIGLNQTLFFFELGYTGNDDAIRFAPVDSTGTVIEGWELMVDFAGLSGLLSYEINREGGSTLTGADLVGFTFSLADFATPDTFAGTPGDLSLAEGLKMIGNNNSDPAVFGLVVPEPTTWVLLASLLPLAAWARRRRR